MANQHTALITGATGDIGKAIAQELAANGCRLALSSIEAEALERMKAEFAALGHDVVTLHSNLMEANEADGLFGRAVDALGNVDILVNNAGITKDNLILRMSDTDWDLVIRLNLEAGFRLCRAAARPMIAQRYGRIINISSVVGFMGNPGQVNYCASKAGLVGMSKALAREVGSCNVTVNCVAPGFIDSAMTKGLPENVKDNLLSAVPSHRMGTPEEVAYAVGFLASERAGYITGSTLHVNGGLYFD